MKPIKNIRMRKLILLLISLCAMNLYAQDEEVQESKTSYYPNGFKMRFDRITFGMNLERDWDEGGRYLKVSNGFAINFGYQPNKHLYYGVGTELRSTLDIFYIDFALPIYANVQFCVSDKVTSPYIGLKFGGCVSLRGECNAKYKLFQGENGKWFHEDYQSKTDQKGLYIHPEIGVRMGIVGLGIGVPITEHIRNTTIYNSQTKIEEKKRLRSFDVGANLVLSFRVNL